ncbi:hypothetical protein HOLleu_06732 [Holothuria leucospilota]|uniref:Uncharacterized protein n=1 Tax=Holothuria leucospilota TaxID=206669 RepID=A0A9Q1CLP3_HOLLE|nr:hypothetical protein HOLleu_06732 [Holothuria leucospilota]
MDCRIFNICKSAYCHLRNISRIQSFLSKSDAEKLVHAFTSSNCDSCNSFKAGLPVIKFTVNLLFVSKMQPACLVVRAQNLTRYLIF